MVFGVPLDRLDDQVQFVRAVYLARHAVAEAITTITPANARAFFRHCGYGIQQL